MDPLESIREYREQSDGRKIRLAPPPALPVPPQVDTPIDPEAKDLEEVQPPYGEQSQSTPGHVPGTPRGRKRLLQVYLPAGTRRLLEAARDGHGSLGAAAMAALRGSYEHIIANHIPEPVEPVGPFPAPRTVRRREHVDDARMKPIYVDPAEAAAIEQLADQCELSISELVTIAIDHYYGEG
jgi:hypothetical protein